MEKTFSVIGPSQPISFDFEEESPWKFFKDTFFINGWEFKEQPEEAAFLISLNHHKSFDAFSTDICLPGRRVLVMMEPNCVSPVSHKVRNQKLYGAIFSPSPTWVRSSDCRLFRWPNTDKSLYDEQKNWSERKSRFAFIQSNNFSFVKGEFYSLRRRVINNASSVIDVAGSGWRDPYLKVKARQLRALHSALEGSWRNIDLKSGRVSRPAVGRYLGKIADKISFLEEYKFSLVIENCDSYVSEKLVDAIVAGTIPLYIGGNLEIAGLPNDVARISKPHVSSIEREILDLLSDESGAREILQAGRRYLESEQYKVSVNSIALRNLASQILEFFNQKIEESKAFS